MLTFNSILLSSPKPKELTEFYCRVLSVVPEWSDGSWFMIKIGSGRIGIGPHEKIKGKNTAAARIILNFQTQDVMGEYERVKKNGAKVIAQPYALNRDGSLIATFEDPDGNYFQLMSPFKIS
jgi:predicted enzyme related to lactoylglutathione lyase